MNPFLNDIPSDNNANIPPNPILNHPLYANYMNNLNNNNHTNSSNNRRASNNLNNNKQNKEQSDNNVSNQLSEEQKKEIEVENDIRDKLKCYICLSKVNKPKMCKFCKRLSCSECINSWLRDHDFCGICKKHVTYDDLILVPFVDDMSTYFINNIENQPKHKLDKIDNSQMKNKTQIISKKKKNQLVNEMDLEEEEPNKDICSIHGNKIEYYCVQCDKYFCSSCLVFFGQEGQKHKNHLILGVSQMNDLGILEAVNEYKKLPQTKDDLEHLIGLCNLKLKENKIKKCEIQDNMNTIKNLYIKKLEESTQELETILKSLEHQKERIDNSIGAIPKGFNNIINSNDHAQGNIMSAELKKLNKLDKNIENDIKEKSKSNPRLFIENYETNIIEIKVPFSGQYNEGAEIFNKAISIIPDTVSNLVIQYIQNRVYVSLSIDINLPLNSPEYPKYYSYVVVRNQKYGLEFSNLSNQVFPQEANRGNPGKSLSQQINNIDFDFEQFVYLSGEEKIVKMKIFITKVYFKE